MLDDAGLRPTKIRKGSIMNRSIFLAASIAMSIGILSTTFPPKAEAGCCVGCFSCPDCRCKLTAEEVEVEKTCFEVECKTICIPKVVFPWQTGKGCFPFGKWGSRSQCDGCDSCDGKGCSSCTNCVNNGAFTRTVKVLKTKKYKCPACEYTWSADESATGCDSGCCDSCCDAGCDGCCASNEATALPQAWQPTMSYQAPQSAGLGVVPVQSIQIAPPNTSGN